MQDQQAPSASYTGCFQQYVAGVGGYGIKYDTAPFDGFSINANLSSSIYTNNGTIRPRSISVLVLLKL